MMEVPVIRGPFEVSDAEVFDDVNTGEYEIAPIESRLGTGSVSSCVALVAIGEQKVLVGHFTNLMKPHSGEYDGDVFRDAVNAANELSEFHKEATKFFVLGGTPWIESDGRDASAADFDYAENYVKTKFPYNDVLAERTERTDQRLNVMVDGGQLLLEYAQKL